MKKANRFLYPFIFLLAVNIYSCSDSQNISDTRMLSFDDKWRFIKADPEGAENVTFDDSDWRNLDLPHDWSIENLPNQSDSAKGPFTKASPYKMRTGYTIGGTAWYRKTFTLDELEREKIAYLQFDGVYMNSDVWVNGQHVGNHPYGYTSFYYDITPYLNPAGQENVVAVQVKNEGANARWYSGSGIYRHTWLTLVDPTHIGMWGVFASTPEVSKEKATLNVSTNVVNSGDQESPVEVQLEIIDPNGEIVGLTN